MQGLFESLQAIHKIGYAHNDLKPSNIMLDNNFNVVLIDFGFATKFMASRGVHHPTPTSLKAFQGNIFYSSQNQMSFMSTSRRDDVISACYLMLTLLNKNKFPGLTCIDSEYTLID